MFLDQEDYIFKDIVLNIFTKHFYHIFSINFFMQTVFKQQVNIIFNHIVL